MKSGEGPSVAKCSVPAAPHSGFQVAKCSVSSRSTPNKTRGPQLIHAMAVMRPLPGNRTPGSTTTVVRMG